MKFIEAIRTHAHVRCQAVRGEGMGRIFQLHGERFYNAWDNIHGLFNIELLQLGRYAQSIQNSEIKTNMVLRNTTIPKKRHEAQTSGFLIQLFPEKTRGVEDVISLRGLTSVPSTSHLPGQGGFKPFLKPPTPLSTALTDTDDKARTDHSGQPPIFCVPVAQVVDRCLCKAEAQGSIPCGHMSGAADRLDYNLLCSPSRERSPT